MKKSDIETRAGRPAINVKCQHFGMYARDVVEQFKCEEATAERALEFWFESACECFWESIGDTITHCFPGYDVKYYSEGRSGGWLVLHGLPDIESWDAILIARFAKFERLVHADIKWRSTREQIANDIEANQWARPGAEAYNFVDHGDGSTACIADLKDAAKAAGFAAVVRR